MDVFYTGALTQEFLFLVNWKEISKQALFFKLQIPKMVYR